jgi:hypothetical protein
VLGADAGRQRPAVGAVVLAAALASTDAGAAPPLFAGPGGPPRIDLVWFDPLNVLPPVVEAVGQEVQTVFEDLGVDTTWTRGAADQPTSPPQVNVVFLAALPSPALPAATLGVVTVGQNVRTLWIVVPNVLRTLGVAPAEVPLGRREAAAVARALGRVVAHEVVHLAAPRLGHTREGLMQKSLDRSSLVEGMLLLDAASRRAVFPALSRLADPASRLETRTIAG